MDYLILANVLEDDMLEILPPERNARLDRVASRCDCCGRAAMLDEDCCGICEECLSP